MGDEEFRRPQDTTTMSMHPYADQDHAPLDPAHIVVAIAVESHTIGQPEASVERVVTRLMNVGQKPEDIFDAISRALRIGVLVYDYGSLRTVSE